MGFSVSGSFAILLVATLMAVGTFYGAMSNRAEVVTEARQANVDEYVATTNTAIEITRLTYSDSNLTIHVNNTGGTALSVNATDVVVDGAFQHRPFVTETVGGNSETDLWLPGEELRIVIGFDDRPNRTKIVTEHGIADSEVV